MKVIITGGTKGIGRAIAEVFANKGFDIAICARTASDLESLKADFEQRYPTIQVLTKVADLSKKEQVLQFAEFIKQHWTQADVLVNNAGLFYQGTIEDEPEGNLEYLMQTNLYSAYHLTRAVLALMLPYQSGHIFNICSIASLAAYPNSSAYTISKFAMLGFSKTLREEMKTKGVRVTSIMPGATWSNSWAGIDLPKERLMPAKDVAETVWSAFVLSKSSVIEDIVLRPQLGDL